MSEGTHELISGDDEEKDSEDQRPAEEATGTEMPQSLGEAPVEKDEEDPAESAEARN